MSLLRLAALRGLSHPTPPLLPNMQPFNRAPSRRLAAFALVLAAAALLGAAASAPAAPSFSPAAPSVVVSVDDGDSLTLGVTWRPVADANGAADGYNLAVYDSTGSGNGSSTRPTLVALALGAGDTTALARVPAPGAGRTRLYVVELRAVRRGKASTPASLTLPVARPDVAPPAPAGLRVDTVTTVGAVTSAADCRPLVASVVSRVESDTAWFVRALPGIPADDVHLFCVANDLAVGLDGWIDGTPEVPPSLYPPGAPLPFLPSAARATSPSRAAALVGA